MYWVFIFRSSLWSFSCGFSCSSSHYFSFSMSEQWWRGVDSRCVSHATFTGWGSEIPTLGWRGKLEGGEEKEEKWENQVGSTTCHVMIGSGDKAVLRCIPDIWVLPRQSTKEKGDLKQQPAPPPPGSGAHTQKRIANSNKNLSPGQCFLTVLIQSPL